METKTTFFSLYRTISIIIVYGLGIANLFAQNLVENPGFENFTDCPDSYGSFQEDVKAWYKPTDGSTDYFNTCGGKLSVGQNFIGKQDTYEGNAYAGFYAYGPNDYREYITGQLVQTLEKGQKYKFSFKVSLAEKSQFAIDELGMLFSSDRLELNTKRNISFNWIRGKGRKNFVAAQDPRYFKDKNEWMEASGEFIAEGTETYFSIGNFKSNSETHRKRVANNLKKAAYYYIDMVKVEKIVAPFEIGETHVLENLFFEVNGHQIIGDGKKELQQLVDHLKANPDLNISIYGHTDNIGSKTYNKVLSQKRAKEIGLFLLENDLSPSRIAWKGFGDLNPVAANETKEGRKKNRRVEFVFSKRSNGFYASNVFEEEE